MGPAAKRWAEELAGWAIPQEVLDSVPESPWGFPPALFGAPRHDVPDTPTLRRATEALPQGGTVLDVGAGGGAASLPLAPRAARIVAVDETEAMLASFATSADELGIEHAEVLGRWPEVAGDAPVADVVVCANVFYNVADLVPFAAALTDHARVRVVAELTESHPLVAQNRLWAHFHPDVPRPSGPTADDAVTVLTEAGLNVEVERFPRPRVRHGRRADWVSFVRRRLCVPVEREPEVDALVDDPEALVPPQAATVWWPGAAR